MNIFTKTALISILNSKVSNKEIVSYSITNNKNKDGNIVTNLTIQKKVPSKAKIKGHVIDITCLSGEELIKLLYREIPDNVKEHFKIEIRNVKLRRIL